MAIEVVTAVEPDFIRITAKGEYSLESLYSCIDQVKTEADKALRKMVLIDSRDLVGDLSDAERFFVGRKVAEKFGSRLKTAVITSNIVLTKLAESVAVSRGAKLLVTESEEEALEWLLTD